jgi:putative transposase
MPRKARRSVGGMIYHVLNRANSRQRIFNSTKDYLAFLKVLGEAKLRWPGVEIFCLCIMPNHWHLVVRPAKDGELSDFMRWITQTHTQRWRHAKQTVGYGALYQGRFKSFPVKKDRHLLVLCRYVERNPLRVERKLVDRAEDWRWSSVWFRCRGDEKMRQLLSPWPVNPPANWLAILNQPQPEKDEQSVGISIRRNRPFGDSQWLQRISTRLGLQHTLSDPGRPKANKA